MKTFVISIIGKPNVGKSTLINNILKQPFSIVSYKPQTTRNKVKGLYKEKDFQLLIIDTPGYHNPKNKLDLFLNNQVKQSLKEADGYLFLIDAKRGLDDEDFELFNKINTFTKKDIIFVINKIDLVDKERLDKIVLDLNNNFEARKILKISAINNDDAKDVINEIKKCDLYQADEMQEKDYELDDKFIVSEIIREQILLHFKQEIPYSVAVIVDELKYDRDRNLLKIYANIIVEKESQKPIIIGKNGSAIKAIGIESRKKMLEIFDSKIFLELNVKVKKKWRDDNMIITSFGYVK